MVKFLPLFTCCVELEAVKFLVCGNDFRGSLGLSCGIFKMASLIAFRHKTLCLSGTFSYLAMFCKIYRYPKHRKSLAEAIKLLLTSHYRTWTKQNCHVSWVPFIINLFSILAGLSVVFSLGN